MLSPHNYCRFHLAATNASTAEPINSSKATESKVQTRYGIEDLFMGSPSVIPSVSEKSQKDVKNDVMNLFGKVNVSKFYVEIMETI